MKAKTSPRAGWYPDPLDDERLRLWDGSAWTTRTSRRVRGDRRAQREATGAVRAAIIVSAIIGATALTVSIASHSTSLRQVAPSASGSLPAPHATTTASIRPRLAVGRPHCDLPMRRPTAIGVVDALSAVGATAAATRPALPKGACGIETFTVAGHGGIGVVVTYPDASAALAAASALPRRAPVFADFIYVVELAPGQRGIEPRAIAALHQLVARSNPLTSG